MGVFALGRYLALKMLARCPVAMTWESLNGCGLRWAASESGSRSGVHIQILLGVS